VEATPETGMTGRPSLLIHFEQEGISVTIEIDFFDLLKVPRSLSLHPKLIARP
jgi:hypothetical protein